MLPSKTWMLHAWGKRHARRYGEHNSKQDNDDGISSLLSDEPEKKRAKQEAGDRSQQKQPQISRVKMFSQEVERSGNQAQDAREHECRAHRFTGRQPNDQNESRNGEAPSANT